MIRKGLIKKNTFSFNPLMTFCDFTGNHIFITKGRKQTER